MATKDARQALYERLADEMDGLHAQAGAAADEGDYERASRFADEATAIFDLLRVWDDCHEAWDRRRVERTGF
jgi:hypothetical protein